MKIPILMYHKIAAEGDFYTVSPYNFRRQMELLKCFSWQGISLGEALKGVKFPKTVVLTFDDGDLSDYNLARPVLNEYGFKATFFVSTADISREGYLTKAMIKELVGEGHEVGSHAHEHLSLKGLDERALEDSLKKSKQILSRITGRPVQYLSMPGGSYDERVIRIARELSFRNIAVSHPDYADLDKDNYITPRFVIRNHYDLADFQSLIEQKEFFHKCILIEDKLKDLVKASLGRERYEKIKNRIFAGSAK